MLGRNAYTQEELDQARSAIARQQAAYRKLLDAAGDDPPAEAARAAFEPLYFNGLVLVLDRLFVHRVRAVSGKDTNPVTEVEVLADSILGNGGVLRTGKVIKWIPESSVTKLADGDPIALTQAQFGRLATAYFAGIQARFVS